MIIILSLLIDRWWGEPPVRLHPVVWMGRYLKWAGRVLPDLAPHVAFVMGTLLWLLGAVAVAMSYGYVERIVGRELPVWLQIVFTALLLKPLLALRMLLGEVRAVERSLEAGLESGRARLRMIVSRDTAELDCNQIRESALESLAENLSDSVIAPLFWFVIFGLPGAAVYRFANTADAMWGYRGQWEWAGKFAARVDDFLNLIPARMTGLLLVMMGRSRMGLLRRLPGEAARTPSPNSGWPMGAMALVLDVQLRKPDVYVLNERGAHPVEADVGTALRRAELVAWMAAGIFAICIDVLPRLGHV